jgi:hypothetical protein
MFYGTLSGEFTPVTRSRRDAVWRAGTRSIRARRESRATHTLKEHDVATPMVFEPKALWLILRALEQRIASEEARYRVADSGEDSEGDFGNDLNYLRLLRDEFAQKSAAGSGTALLYQCWFDPADQSLSLVRFSRVHELRHQGSLSDAAVLQYAFVAETYEEAMAVHCLRQGWAPYLPMGEAGSCPRCSANYYPEGYGDCWRCGHIG